MMIREKINHFYRWLLLGVFSCCITIAWSQPSNELGTPFMENFNPKVYKGFPQVFGLAQGEDGIVYFSGNGVVEYDGKTWRKISMKGAVTWSLSLGDDERMYVGGTDDVGYLKADSLGRQSYVSLLSLVPEGERKFGQLRQSATAGKYIYFASKTGHLLEYNCSKKVFKTWNNNAFFTILGVVNDQLYLDVAGKGLSVVKDGEIQLVTNGDYFQDILIVKVLPHKEKGILLVTRDQGLFHYSNEEVTAFKTEADLLLSSWTYDAVQLQDQSYVFSVIGQGVIIIDAQGKWLHHLKKEDGLLDDIILKVFASPSGGLWLGANSGVCHVDILSPFSSFVEDENQNPLFLEDIIRFENTLYAASASTNGFLYLDRKGQTFRSIKNQPKGQAFQFLKVENQLLAVGSTGVYILEGEEAFPIYQENDAGFFILSIHQSRLNPNIFFLGLQDGIALLIKDEGKWIYKGRIDQVPSNVAITSTIEKDAGEVWVGTENQGLWKFYYEWALTENEVVFKDVESFSTSSDRTNLGSTGVYLINDELAFTGAGGIYTYDRSKNTIVPNEKFAYASNRENIQRAVLAEDEQGQIYAHLLFFDGTADLGEFELVGNGQYAFSSSIFDELPNEELLNTSKIFPDENGVIWIAGQDGVFRYHNQNPKIKDEYPLKIREVFINEDSLIFSGHGDFTLPVLNYDHNDIRFDYLSTNVKINNHYLYQTKLEGFDGGWSEWTEKGNRAYTNLPEGKYQFRVKGKTSKGLTDVEAVFAFQVLPPIWRTWYAYLFYLVIGASAFIGFGRWRNRRLRKRSDELKAVVKKRTIEIEQKVEELSAINKVQKGLVEQMDMTSIFNLVGKQMVDLFKADIAYIAILDLQNQTIHFPFGIGDSFQDMPLGEGLTSRILQSGSPILINKNLSKAHSELGIELTGKVVASFLGVPIKLGENVIGVMSVQSTTHANRFLENDQRLLSTIATQVGIALYNAELYKAAEIARSIAEEANEVKSTFLSTVSHELRTPLTSVIGFAKIIKKRLDERILPFVVSEEKKTHRAIKQVTENLNVVVSEGERLTTLINTVLDLAKIEAGRIDWNMESVQIEAIVNQAVAATSSLFEQKSLPLKIIRNQEIPDFTGDRDRLVQVVINLISNAVKFTDEGDVKINITKEEERVVVSVQDSGIGISENDLPKVFEKFKQVGDTLTDKPKGTGLGLPICKEIIEHHGGEIWVTSEIGKGSTFYFSVPINKEISSSTNEAPDEGIDITEGVQNKIFGFSNLTSREEKCILIVDDEPSIRSLLRQELSEVGYRTQEACNGKEALEAVKDQRPDLILLDVVMPEMDGFETAQRLKENVKTKDIPIIVVSITDDKQRMSQIGVDGYLTKPIDNKLLLKKISTLTRQRVIFSND